MPSPTKASVLLLLLATGAAAALNAQGTRFDRFGETRPRVGQRAPQFTLTRLDGSAFDLDAATARQPVVLEFGSYT